MEEFGLIDAMLRFDVRTNEEEAWGELLAHGVEPLYSTETLEGHTQIYGRAPDVTQLLDLKSISCIHQIPDAPIDWESQWATHGMDFRDGHVHVDLKALGCVCDRVLVLEPGPGFGDLSHPTTRLVLRLMESHVLGKKVLDIGTGSGILALAAVATGAAHVYAIDIDEEAVVHAERNRALNGMEENISFELPEDRDLICVMNMIWSEQQTALETLSTFDRPGTDWIVSGILESERDPYILYCEERGWMVCQEISEEGWMAFHCKHKEI